MARRRSKPQPKPGPDLGQLLRGEIIGGVLVVAAILLMLSMLSSKRGNVTGAMIEALQVVFGAGAWLVPVLLGGLGAWLALRQVTDQTVLSSRRLAGALGLFLAAEAIVHLVFGGSEPQTLAAGGGGGGMIGYWFSQGLIAALGAPAAIGMLVVLVVLSVLALTGLTWAELSIRAAAVWRRVRGAFPGPEGRSINPPLPLGYREWPWQHWWRRLTGWRPADLRPPALPPAVPSPGMQGAGAHVGSSPAKTPSSAPAAPYPAPAAAQAELQPRIIGGRGQTWRVPTMADVLEDSSELDIQGEDLRRRAHIIETTLEGFGVPVQVVEANQGPAVTQFGLKPGIIVRKDRKGEEKRIKVRVSQIQALSNDLSLALAASPIRIEAPVPGRDIVGVEVPNVQISLVPLRGVLESEEFRVTKGPLVIGLGRDVSGQAAVTDLTRMPHLLIAGATGSGKSVCVNAIITALLLTHTPDSLRFLMIDPKRVELTNYNGIPHLIAPVVVDVERAVPVLQWATREMERRYKVFAKVSARNIESYNEKLTARGEQILPYIVILIDELADLMLSAPDDVERYVCRIAQMARATGIHLVIATQRPSVDVVTGLIKANFPARIAFAVTSSVDSRVILDTPGAEQLLGRGDMLYMAPDSSKLQRLQGCVVSERETQRLVRYWRGARAFVDEDAEAGQLAAVLGGTTPADGTDLENEAASGWPAEPADSTAGPPWLPGQEMLQQPLWSDLAGTEAASSGQDELYIQAVQEVRKSGRASVSLLQRRLRVGYSRAARLIEQMEADGIVGPDLGGSRGREVLPAAAREGPTSTTGG
jgi:S-DNA-T family DNA segregation ATPase FtsK/SpoIIIE